MVIGDRPLDQLVPLFRDTDSRDSLPATQFNMKWVEPAGLVKFDFLGLKTLTVIEKACDLIGRDKIDIPKLPLDDKKTFELLARGDGSGVFQLEGNGMRDVLRKLKPDRFEDIIAWWRSIAPARWRTSRATSSASTARRRRTTCIRCSKGS